MPSRVNGIGTWYIGKSQVENYRAVCDSCRREAMLQNYQTRQWFTFLFIPVIPLGRKQILGQCSLCTRHRALPLEEWERIKTNSIAEEQAAAAARPDDAAAGLKLFSALIAFRDFDKAAAQAQTLLDRFPRDPDVCLQIASWHETMGRNAQANALYLKAFDLAPRHSAAKRAAAIIRLEEGDPDGARRLLDSSPETTPRDDPQAFIALARGYQQQNRHADALDLFGQVLRAYPKFGTNKDFRKLVRTSEQTTVQPNSMLPSIPIWHSAWFWVPATAAAVVLIFGGIGYYIAQNRTLHVVNGFNVPVQVALDDGESFSVGPQSHTKQTVAEGAHHARFVLPGNQERTNDFTIESSFFGRVFSKSAYVLNLDGAAALVQIRTTYSENPRPDDGDLKWHIGQPFIAFDSIDYPFEKMPDKISIKQGQRVDKFGIDAVYEPMQALIAALQGNVVTDWLTMAEAHLRVDGDNTELLAAYSGLNTPPELTARRRSFLEAFLDRVPLRIEWHRAYQNLRQESREEAKLIADYQQRLDKDANNSALLYLRGRIEPDPAAAVALYDRAIAADAANAYPWYARSHHRLSMGDFAVAKKDSEEACRMQPGNEQMRAFLQIVRLASGDYPALEQESRTAVQTDPTSSEKLLALLEVLAAEKKTTEISGLVGIFERVVLAQENTSEARQFLLTIRLRGLYLQGDMQQFRTLADTLTQPDQKLSFLFRERLESGALKEAAGHLSADTSPDAFAELCMSIGWRQQGDAAQADEWQRRSLDHFAPNDQEGRRLAGFFKQVPHVTFEEVRQTPYSSPVGKAVFLTALAQQCPEQRAELVALAEKLNFSPVFPHRFLADVLAKLHKGP